MRLQVANKAVCVFPGMLLTKMVGERGLEPPRTATQDPKSSASTIPPLARS